MEHLNATPNALRNLEIVEAMSKPRQRGDLDELVEQFGLSKSRLNQIWKEGPKPIEVFELTLTDGSQKIPVAEVECAEGFSKAARCAMSHYSAMFDRLELPCWRLISQSGHAQDVKSLRA